MKLTAREAAKVLGVSETKVYRWVADGEIPFSMVHHHPLFHRVDLLEWAMARELPVSVDLYEDERDQPLTAALERGGGRIVAEGGARIADELPIQAPADVVVVRALMSARTGEMFVGRSVLGIAIPKARSPIVCPGQPAFVMLAWCGEGALTIGETPAQALFVIVAPTIMQHLQLLSRLSVALHDEAFVGAVRGRGAIDGVIAEARRFELALQTARRSGARSDR